MTKIALLIGVSDYKPGLRSLPCAPKDVEALQRVLINPEIGEFAVSDVNVLINPQRQEMERAIYGLFANRQKEDLLLFYFSGHGVKDESGKLYLATSETEKEQGKLVKPTAVAASTLHECMNESRSQQQVMILDCCFSGAIAQGLTVKDDGTVDIHAELGGKGRAILTSSTSTQYSFEQEGAELSIYTRYLVEGIETGAADHDEDGRISVDGLHEYASSKVKEAAPAMTPKLYPIEEGYKIYLAKAPIGDPKLKYRRKVEEIARKKQGKISSINRIALDELREKLNLLPEEASEIEAEVLRPYRIREQKLQRYEQAFSQAIRHKYPLSEENQSDLQELQQVLSLRDKDVAPIQAEVAQQMGIVLPTNTSTDLEAIPITHPENRDEPLNVLPPPDNRRRQLKIAAFSSFVAVCLGLIGVTQFTNDPKNVPTIIAPSAEDFPTDVKDIPEGRFTYRGSTTWEPIRHTVDKIISSHSKFQPIYTPTEELGSLLGIQSLLDGEVNFVQSSNSLTNEQKQRALQKGFSLEEKPIAIDGVAIAVNPKLNLNSRGLTLDQLKGIYTGAIKNWQDLGGPNLSIKAYSRSPDKSGTVQFFQEKVLANHSINFNVVTQVGTTTDAWQDVSKEEGGIYFATASEVISEYNKCHVKPLPLVEEDKEYYPYKRTSIANKVSICSAQPPYETNREAFFNGSYPLTRELYIVIKHDNSIDQKAGEAYANLLLTPWGQKLIEQAGFAAINKINK